MSPLLAAAYQTQFAARFTGKAYIDIPAIAVGSLIALGIILWKVPPRDGVRA